MRTIFKNVEAQAVKGLFHESIELPKIKTPESKRICLDALCSFRCSLNGSEVCIYIDLAAGGAINLHANSMANCRFANKTKFKPNMSISQV